MYRIHQQAKARQDLKNIWLYTYENFGVDQADKYFDERESGMETIRNNPLKPFVALLQARAIAVIRSRPQPQEPASSDKI